MIFEGRVGMYIYIYVYIYKYIPIISHWITILKFLNQLKSINLWLWVSLKPERPYGDPFHTWRAAAASAAFSWDIGVFSLCHGGYAIDMDRYG